VAFVSPEEEYADSVTSPDLVSPADSSGPDEVPSKKKSGGCSASSNASGASALLLLLLIVLRSVRLRLRGLPTLVAVVVASGACSTGSDGYIPPQDLKPVDDASSKPDLSGLDSVGRSEVFSDSAAGELVGDNIGELPDTLPETVELTPDDIGPDQAETDVGEEPPFDCAHIPLGPFVLEDIPGAIASEDLAFDGQGHLIGSNNKAIFKTDLYGNTYLFSPNLNFRAGLAYLPNGWLIVNDNYLGRLVKIDPEGVQHVLLQGLEYPNGITVDMNGWVYVTEHDANRVLRVHPYTGEYTVLTYEISNPNGIAFSVDYKTLFVGSFGAGWIYSMSIAEDGTPGRLEEWGNMKHTAGMLDGIAVDMCGNVYVCEYGATEIWRFGPDGQGAVKILDATDLGTYLPNLRFGDGKGWDSSSLYSPDGWDIGAWRVNIGVPAPPLPFP
jgi:sugar lactone lactonase YvrE